MINSNIFSKKTLLLTVIFSAVVFAGCTPATDTDSDVLTTDQPDSTQAVQETISATDEDMMEEAEMVIEMSPFKFSETEITASPGDTITIKLVNVSGTHDFVIDELDVQSDQIDTGEETMVTIEVPQDAKSGTEYAYYCSVGNHRAQGMEGTLVIE